MEMQYINQADVEELRRSKEAYMEEARIAKDELNRWRDLALERRTTMLDFASSVDAFLSALAEEELIEDSDQYMQHIQKWIDNGTLDSPFTSEVSYIVSVDIRRTFEVLVKKPASMDDSDVIEKLMDAFSDASGDADCVIDDLGDECEIQDISTSADDVSVDAEVR